MEVYRVLRSEKQSIVDRLNRLARTTSVESDLREELFDEVRRRIEHVNVVEERYLYPLLVLHPEAQHAVERARRENDGIEHLVDALRAMAPTDVEFPSYLERLRQAVHRHVEFEEREIFGCLEALLPGEHAEMLARQIVDHPQVSLAR